MEKLISIIVPVHNTKKYIEQCIESILGQTYKKIEIVCIDSSTDDTKAIIDKYADKDARIVHIKDTNNSYGYKLNKGIEVAKGDYIGIVDSDDYILPEMYSSLMKEVQNNSLDFVKSDFTSFYISEGSEVEIEHKENLWEREFYNKILNFKEIPELLDRISVSIWTGLYDKNFLNKNEIRLHETEGASFQDTGFSVMTHLCAERVKYVNCSFYRYRTDNVDSSVKSQKKYKVIADEWHYIEAEMRKKKIAQSNILFQIKKKKYSSYWWNYMRLEKNAAYMFADAIHQEVKEECIDHNDYQKFPNFLIKRIQVIWCEDNPYTIFKKDTECIRKLLTRGNVILFGLGTIGKRIADYDILCNTKGVVQYCDNFASMFELSGKEYEVKKIQELSDKELRGNFLIANKYHGDEIKKQIMDFGIEEEKITICNTFPSNYTDYVLV